MTSYEFERALVYLAEQIIKTFGEDVGTPGLKQEPAEPLIKDKKIRKAVRVWAEANGVKIIRIRTVGKTLLRSIGEDMEGYYIDIEFMVDNTDSYEDLHDNTYTITELCGEEKE